MSYGTSGGSGRIQEGRPPCVVLATLAAVACVLGVGAVGCNNDKKPTGGDLRPPASSAGGATSAKTNPAANASASASAVASAPLASASSSAAAPPPPAEPIGTGVGGFVAAGQTDTCKALTTQVADYLQRGDVSLAGHDGAVAAAWIVKLSANKSQLAFAGFSLDAKQVARARGVGNSSDLAPRLFSAGQGWTLVWFDAGGLAYASPRWETSPAPKVERLSAVASADAEHVSLASTPSGAIIAVAPFGADKSQFGLFLFAPIDPGAPPVHALNATHHAKKPRWPAVISDERGYTLAWHEEGDQIVASRFDLKGKELGEPVTIVDAGAARGRVSLAATAKGAIAMWAEGDKLFARALDGEAHPGPETWIVGYGKNPSLVSFGEGALAVFTGQDGTASNQVLAVKLGPNGSPSAKGLRLTETGPAKDAPAAVVVGARAGFLWTEPMTQGVGTKRALLRTIEAACIP